MTSGLFSGNKKSEEDFIKKVDVHSRAILTVVEKQKQIETNLEILNEKTELLDHNFTQLEKKEINDIKSIRQELLEIKKEIENLKDFALRVKKELSLTARKEEVNVLKKYIDLWNPIDFVTRDELEKVKEEIIKILEEILKR